MNELPVAIRLNPFKGADGPAGEPIPWSPWGRILPERPVFTLDPLFHAGCYYVQDASAMYVGHIFRKALDKVGHKGIRVLDLCAAPGGKTTDLATSLRERYGDDFLLVSNEVMKERARVLSDNIALWGDPNILVCSTDPAVLGRLSGFFDIIVADVSMGTLDMALFTKISRENIVRSILRPVIERGYYDYILIDTNPNLSLLNFNIVNASNFVLIPAQPASFDLDGLAVVLQFVEGIKPYNPTLQVGGIIINRYDARNRLITEAAMDQLREAYSPLLFEQIIRVDSRLQNAQWENRPVQDYAGNARISKEYRALTKEILRRCS